MTTVGWFRCSLGEAVTFQRGYDITKKEQREGPYPVISSSGPTTTHDQFKAEGPGVVIGRKGSLGGVYFSEGPYWPHDTTLWVREFHGNSPLFVYYLLQTLGLSQYDVGASNPTLNRNHIHLLPVCVPPRPTQERIAAVLSVYDNLIENNTRRIQILEEMAQAIYREWFVEFRFPGHEDMRMMDSEVGSIPAEWEARRLSEVAKVIMGQSPSSSFYNDIGEGLPFHQGVTNFGKHFPTHKAFSTSGDRRAETGDILFSVRAPVGRINVSDRDLILGRGLCAIRPAPTAAMFVLFQLKHVFRMEDIIGSGAIFNAVKRSDIDNLSLIWPAEERAARFGELVGPMFSLIKSLTFASVLLRQARDLLLPRLISGEIDVSNLDIGNAEPAA